MIVAEGIMVARTLGEARSAIERLELTNWVPTSPSRPVRGVKSANCVLVVDNFDVPEPVLASIRLAVGSDSPKMAGLVFYD